MKPFTGNWQHVGGSPWNFDDTRDLHSDGRMALLATFDGDRPSISAPAMLRDSSTMRELLADVPPDGETTIEELMLLTRELKHKREAERYVCIKTHAFDARRIWKLCVAVLGYRGQVSWRLHELDTAGAFVLLIGESWRGIIMSYSGGTGPVILRGK